jgi:hypothetical protein
VTRPRGRPILGDQKRVRLDVYATPEEIAVMDRLRERDAARSGCDLPTQSDWLLRSAGVRPVLASLIGGLNPRERE